MPTISMFYGILVSMYLGAKEHGRPHIHADYGEFSAVFDIVKAELVHGDMPRPQRRMVEAWIEIRREVSIPSQTCHPFRANPATCSGERLPGIPG